ncbi:MAG: FAD-binding oxidoreductase [Pseudomonadota bacterium]
MNLLAAKKRFLEILGSDGVLDDSDSLVSYSSDYTEEPPQLPSLVVLPQTAEQVQEIVKIANEEQCTLTPRVTASNVGGLAIPPVGGVVVDLHRMRKIIEVNQEDMYALIEPGVTWEQLKSHLEESNIPLRLGYPLSPPDTSIVANCLLDGLGNLSMRYGSMADWIGGIEAVLPDGQLIKTGAAALSNFWFGRGPLPDLTGLFVCWQGTTGIVTKMAFQLWPLPPHRQRMFILTYDRNAAFSAMRDLCRIQVCDDVGGLSWPTGKMLFGVQKPEARDPAEPEFFLYLDISGQTERELNLRLEILKQYLEQLRSRGFAVEDPLDIRTLVKLNPEFAKLAEFPTRLGFLVDHPGGGLSWVGTYGPLSQFEKFADGAIRLMNTYKRPPIVVSRPMNGGHFGVMRFISTFDKSNQDECRIVREINEKLVDLGLEFGFIPYKTPPWVVEKIRSRLDPAFMNVMQKIRATIDPNRIMSPRCWPMRGPG